MVSRSYKEFAPSHKSAPDPSCKRIGDVPGDERFEVSIYLKPRNNERSAGTEAQIRAPISHPGAAYSTRMTSS